MEKYQEYFDSINEKLEAKSIFKCQFGFAKHKHQDVSIASVCLIKFAKFELNVVEG